MTEKDILDEINKLKNEIDESYTSSKQKLEAINKESLFALGEEYGFKKYIINENGEPMFFTMVMFNSLGQYEKVMDDYNIHSIRELRQKLDKLNEYEHRD